MVARGYRTASARRTPRRPRGAWSMARARGTIAAVSRRARWIVAVIAGLGCGGGRSPAVAPVAPVDEAPAVAPDAVVSAQVDAVCRARCLGQYAAASDDGYPAYCDELCTPPAEPSQPCIDSCVASHEPGARYADDGEYVRDEDTRTDAQQQAERVGCVESCADVPVVSDAGMQACVDACVGEDGNELACRTSCDPDPYDACKYVTCD